MKITVYPLIASALISSCAQQDKKDIAAGRPNVILIYTDDVGYGDIGIYGGKVPTPKIDQLAREGIMFTNAYATAATCTPSRFSLLTGEYAWRHSGTGVVDGDASALIPPGKDTWPSLMQRAGYNTSVIGKWHLGLGGDEGPDWNGKITPGPLETGFDYAWLIPATNDRVPTVYVENHHVVNLDPDDPIEISFRDASISDRPTGRDNPELLKMMWSHGHNHSITNGISRIGYMKGGETALWRDEDIADVLVEKAVDFIDANRNGPFFMYFSTVDIHVPRIVHERFQEITPFGPRGDMIVQLDWTVGALVEALEERGLTERTMIIFTSDNGPVLDDGYVDFAAEKLGDHEPWGEFRGGKYSAFEAGTRVPMIVRWPGIVERGASSNALFSQVDMLASFAAFTGQQFNQDHARDSRDHWNVLVGEDADGRDGLVQQAIQQALTYVRNDGYKFIPAHNGSPRVPWGTDIETGFSSVDQLYDLNTDPGETRNIAADNPGIVSDMRGLLNEVIRQ
jgi:arylsulfatase A-like enzyme